MKANAPMPPTDRTVVRSSNSVKVWSACVIALGARFGGESILERNRGALHSSGQLLGDRVGNQPSNDVTNNNASHAPRWLLQCCLSSETHHIHNLIRHHCSGEVLPTAKTDVNDQSSCLKVSRNIMSVVSYLLVSFPGCRCGVKKREVKFVLYRFLISLMFHLSIICCCFSIVVCVVYHVGKK